MHESELSGNRMLCLTNLSRMAKVALSLYVSSRPHIRIMPKVYNTHTAGRSAITALGAMVFGAMKLDLRALLFVFRVGTLDGE